VDLESLTKTIRAAVPDLQAVYMFGSRARGDAGPKSDLDLAVLADKRLPELQRWALQERLAQLAHMDVDLVDLRRASTVLRVQVLASGQVLADVVPRARAEFEAIALGAYARFQDERRGIVEDARARGRVHG